MSHLLVHLQDLQLIISTGIYHGADSLVEEKVHILRISSNKALTQINQPYNISLFGYNQVIMHR